MHKVLGGLCAALLFLAGLPQIGQAAVFAQKWRYHAYF